MIRKLGSEGIGYPQPIENNNVSDEKINVTERADIQPADEDYKSHGTPMKADHQLSGDLQRAHLETEYRQRHEEPRTLKQGSSGLDVYHAQHSVNIWMMMHYGHSNITEDGQFGPETEKAVKEFQKANGLVPDGIIGPKTLSALTRADREFSAEMNSDYHRMRLKDGVDDHSHVEDLERPLRSERK